MLRFQTTKIFWKSFIDFTQVFLKEKYQNLRMNVMTFLTLFNCPLGNSKKSDCDKALTMKDLEDALFKMSIGKSHGNDGLSV